jgi:hypothetical protein
MLLDVEGLAFVALLLLWVWALLDCIATDPAMCRNLPKMMWILIVLFLPDIGSLAWLLLGRPEKASWQPGSVDYSSSRRPIGPEDSPRYSPTPIVTDRRSQELDAELEKWERERAAKQNPELDKLQAELDQREADLRRRELELRQRDLEQRERELDQ